MEKVEVFKTTDGMLFEDGSKALEHETKLEFHEWYSGEENELHRVDAGDLLTWLFEHKDTVLGLFQLQHKSMPSVFTFESINPESVRIPKFNTPGWVEVAVDPLGWQLTVLDNRGSVKDAATRSLCLLLGLKDRQCLSINTSVGAPTAIIV